MATDFPRDRDEMVEFFVIYHRAVGWCSVDDVLFAMQQPATLGNEFDLWSQLGKPEPPMKYPPTDPVAAAAYATRDNLWDLFVDSIRALRVGTRSASELIADQSPATWLRLRRAEATAWRDHGSDASDMSHELSRGAWDLINSRERRQPYVEGGPVSIQEELDALAHPEPVG
jgi:hypothetical protein